jgi:hypothetical protein
MNGNSLVHVNISFNDLYDNVKDSVDTVSRPAFIRLGRALNGRTSRTDFEARPLCHILRASRREQDVVR